MATSVPFHTWRQRKVIVNGSNIKVVTKCERSLCLEAKLWLQLSGTSQIRWTNKYHQYFPKLLSLSHGPPVSLWSSRFSIPGGDSSCSWEFLVCALGYNFGKSRAFTLTTLQEDCWSRRKYTRLHSWTLCCPILSWYTVRVGNQQSWLSINSKTANTLGKHPAKYTINKVYSISFLELTYCDCCRYF